MKVEYDAQTDTLTITLREARIRESDELVHALYGLTPEEIKIVESASGQTPARPGSAAI